LRENGIEAAGWDPYYAPDNPIAAADMVNLGFVVNVIEDFDERLEALTRAWSLTRGLPRASHGVRGALVPLRACRFR
jgi:DNA phosphorothioation-associated putative methyltransferase